MMSLRRLQKTGRDSTAVTCCGRTFQTREAATGKARSPKVDSGVRRTSAMVTTRNKDSAVLRYQRIASGFKSSSAACPSGECVAWEPLMDSEGGLKPRNPYAKSATVFFHFKQLLLVSSVIIVCSFL